MVYVDEAEEDDVCCESCGFDRSSCTQSKFQFAFFFFFLLVQVNFRKEGKLVVLDIDDR